MQIQGIILGDDMVRVEFIILCLVCILAFYFFFGDLFFVMQKTCKYIYILLLNSYVNFGLIRIINIIAIVI